MLDETRVNEETRVSASSSEHPFSVAYSSASEVTLTGVDIINHPSSGYRSLKSSPLASTRTTNLTGDHNEGNQRSQISILVVTASARNLQSNPRIEPSSPVQMSFMSPSAR